MNPEGPRSILGQLLRSKPTENDPSEPRLRLITENVHEPLVTSPDSFESTQNGTQKSSDHAVRHVQSTPSLQNVSAKVAISPAALFLSSFSSISPPKTTLPDDEGEEVAGYTLGGVIGYGGFSTIRRAFSTSGGTVAVKIVRNSDLNKDANLRRARKRLDREAEIWQTLGHENILPLFKAVHTSYADFFITLLCPAGSLFDILKRDGRPALLQDDAGMMFRQVVKGIHYLHEVVGIVHRDIKLENVLVDDSGVCKITDFGLARMIGEEVEEDEEIDEPSAIPNISTSVSSGAGVHRAASVSQSTFPGSSKKPKTGLSVHDSLIRPAGHGPRHRNSTTTSSPAFRPSFLPGSLPYAAPELLAPQNGPRTVHPSQDIWALGIMLYALLTGRLPFMDSFEPRLQFKILNGVYEMPTGIGSNAERVLKGCLDSGFQSRWNIQMVDEVAWSIGWGSDVSVPIVSDEELRRQASMSRSASQCRTPSSRSRSRPADIIIPSEWEHGDVRSPGSVDAASRRSISRARRSLSRAPAVTDQSSSARSVERVMSRRSSRGRIGPLSSSRSGSLSSSNCSSRARSPSLIALDLEMIEIVDSPLSVGDLQARSAERGRRPHRRDVGAIIIASASLSPSLSAVPTTPEDADSHYSRSQSLSPPDDEELVEIEEYSQAFRERGRKPTKEFPDSSRMQASAYWRHIVPSPENLETLLDESEGVDTVIDDNALDLEQEPKHQHDVTSFRHSPVPMVYSRSDGSMPKDMTDPSPALRTPRQDSMLNHTPQRPYWSHSTPRSALGKQRAGSTPPGLSTSGNSVRFSEFPRPSPHAFSSYSRAPTLSSISGLPVILDAKAILQSEDVGL
ncbi:hypothetical protein D9758_015495 [Tetrapyrgos nigripes]|uniref:Protein kinase domain-containing protein n=1 Tax=Tetrapyrgos nigripes TaxID=182062 RepID=A0A8H5FC08_9AGAR|nr:hypothetical protein D9758_015495 [Tetrapyrgos nigripes]